MFDFNLNCWFRENLGIYCPGCGGTRMVKSILKLDFYQAFRYNPLIFSFLILVGIWIIINIILKVCGKKLILPKEKHFIVLAGVVVIYMLLRNIPGFEFLTPTEI